MSFSDSVSTSPGQRQNYRTGPKPPDISVDGNIVESVNSFVYLRSLQSSDGQCRPDLIRRIGLSFSKTDMERQAPDTRHQAPYIPDTCFICVTIRRWHLDLTISWCVDSGCFPPEVSKTAAWNPMVQPSLKWWTTTTDRSDFTVPSPIPSTHLGIWAYRLDNVIGRLL